MGTRGTKEIRLESVRRGVAQASRRRSAWRAGSWSRSRSRVRSRKLSEEFFVDLEREVDTALLVEFLERLLTTRPAHLVAPLRRRREVGDCLRQRKGVANRHQ